MSLSCLAPVSAWARGHGCLGVGSSAVATFLPLPVPCRRVTLSGRMAPPMTTTTGTAASPTTASTPSRRRRTACRSGTGPAAVSTACGAQGRAECCLHANKFQLLLGLFWRGCWQGGDLHFKSLLLLFSLFLCRKGCFLYKHINTHTHMLSLCLQPISSPRAGEHHSRESLNLVKDQILSSPPPTRGLLQNPSLRHHPVPHSHHGLLLKHSKALSMLQAKTLKALNLVPH